VVTWETSIFAAKWVSPTLVFATGFFTIILLMAEILHHLGCIKPWQLKDAYQRVQDFLHQQYLLTLASSQIPP